MNPKIPYPHLQNFKTDSWRYRFHVCYENFVDRLPPPAFPPTLGFQGGGVYLDPPTVATHLTYLDVATHLNPIGPPACLELPPCPNHATGHLHLYYVWHTVCYVANSIPAWYLLPQRPPPRPGLQGSSKPRAGMQPAGVVKWPHTGKTLGCNKNAKKHGCNPRPPAVVYGV